jgi:hypothetical protein
MRQREELSVISVRPAAMPCTEVSGTYPTVCLCRSAGRFAAICLASRSFLKFGAFVCRQEVRHCVPRDTSRCRTSCECQQLLSPSVDSRQVKKSRRRALTLSNLCELIYCCDNDKDLCRKKLC